MDEFQQFTKDFYAFTGIDLQSYKRPQMERRLTSLRNKHGHGNFKTFHEALIADDALLHELLDKMTINVSEFFRNPERWDALIPFLRDLSHTSHLQAWSAACSTGEEPYTLAMLMEEYVKRPFSILGTDIDERVLQEAQTGAYKSHQIKSVPDALVQKYFVPANNSHGQGSSSVTVVNALKRHISFKRHNLLSNPYPDSLDLIICRNVLIYFTEDAKQRILDGFTKSLVRGGLLFVGSTEQFLHSTSKQLVNVAPFLYRKEG